MRLSVLSSGSSGNVTYIETETGGILVDAGLSCRRIRGLLARIGRGLDDVDAVLLTHGHSDHTSGVPSLVRERNLSVFAAPGVGEKLNAVTVSPGDPLQVGGLEACFFPVPHDAETYGLRLTDGERCGVVATDLGEVTPEVLCWMRGADVAVLEANHDLEWLRRGPYSADLKRRISSPNGHLSNHQAAEAALDLASHGLKDLILAHLSRTNNSPARACGTVSRALREAGHGGVRVRAAIPRHPTPEIEVGEPLVEPGYIFRYGGGQQLFEVE